MSDLLLTMRAQYEWSTVNYEGSVWVISCTVTSSFVSMVLQGRVSHLDTHEMTACLLVSEECGITFIDMCPSVISSAVPRMECLYLRPWWQTTQLIPGAWLWPWSKPTHHRHQDSGRLKSIIFTYQYLCPENFATFQIILMGWQCANL